MYPVPSQSSFPDYPIAQEENVPPTIPLRMPSPPSTTSSHIQYLSFANTNSEGSSSPPDFSQYSILAWPLSSSSSTSSDISPPTSYSSPPFHESDFCNYESADLYFIDHNTEPSPASTVEKLFNYLKFTKFYANAYHHHKVVVQSMGLGEGRQKNTWEFQAWKIVFGEHKRVGRPKTFHVCNNPLKPQCGNVQISGKDAATHQLTAGHGCSSAHVES
ncbi:hypothetical protein BDN70DRAFT_936684 [Pholiota conissans]|uniref:Uncharacterized protein n=1 Tax=Pholiota conissans TaxID=109636 RepID=A0A9P5YR77_9AGAR|nr:hypothetical protein BDN70DRAFT_936684 [Pholiota conissans]